MRELTLAVLGAVLANLITELIKERGAAIAPWLLRTFGRTMARDVQRHYLEPWVADVSLTEGNTAKVMLALSFLATGYAISVRQFLAHLHGAAALMMLLPASILLQPTFSSALAITEITLMMVLLVHLNTAAVIRRVPGNPVLMRTLALPAYLTLILALAPVPHDLVLMGAKKWIMFLALMAQGWALGIVTSFILRALDGYKQIRVVRRDLTGLLERMERQKRVNQAPAIRQDLQFGLMSLKKMEEDHLELLSRG